MSNDLDTGFPLPPQQTAEHPPELSPKALDAWLASLPAGHIEASANKILHTLFTINRLVLDGRDRLVFLEGIYPRCHAVLEALHKRLDNVPAPPDPKERRLGEFVIRLHFELALAFRCVLHDKDASSHPGVKRRFRRAAPPALAPATAAGRAFFHLLGVLRSGYQLSIQPPPHFWPKVYALYNHCKESGWLDQPARCVPGREALAVADAFKMVVLLAVSSPLSLRGREVGALCTLLPDLAPHTRLVPVHGERDCTPAFLIRLMAATAPAVDPHGSCDGCAHADDCMELDVAPLLPKLRQLRNEGPGRPGSLVTGGTLLSTLEERLSPRRRRRTRRFEEMVEVEVIAGLKDVHAYFAPPPTPSPQTTPREKERQHAREAVKALEAHYNPVGYSMVLDLELARLETFEDNRETQDAPAPTLPERKVVPRRARFKSLNLSSGGYCLHSDRPGAFRLHVGELVAIRELPGERWLPATVSWLGSDGGRLQFGVNLLAPRLATGDLYWKDGDASQPGECLLLFDAETPYSPSRILLSPRDLEAGHSVQVRRGSEEYDLRLTRVLSKTHGYVEFLCEQLLADEDPDETVPLLPGTLERELADLLGRGDGDESA